MEELQEIKTEQPASGETFHGTYRSSVVTLSTWAMGCGVLALPRVMAACGVIRGLALLTLFAYWVDLSLRWVVACGRYSGKRSFAGNAEYYLGVGGSWIVHVAQTALLFGGIVSLFVVVASLLPCIARDLLEIVCGGDVDSVEPHALLNSEDVTVSQEFLAAVANAEPGIGKGGIRNAIALAAAGVCWAHPMPCMDRGSLLLWVALIVLPLASQGSLHALRRFSSLGFACLIYFFLALMLRLVLVIMGLSSDPAADDAHRAHTIPLWEAGNPDAGFWQGPPILLMSFLCHTSILRLDEELRPSSKPQVGEVIDTVVLRIALPMYAIVAVGGYFLSGPMVSSNILEDFQGDALMAAARLTLGLLNVIKIPLGLVSLRADLVDAIPWTDVRQRFSTPFGRFAATVLLLGTTLLAASVAGSLSRVLSLMGCTVGVLFSLCLPAALYWRLMDRLAQEELGASTSSGLPKSLRRPLLGTSGSPRQAAACARVAGAVDLPRDAAARLRHRAACLAVFSGGVLVGWLGLLAWLETEATR